MASLRHQDLSLGRLRLQLRERELTIDSTLVMGVVNASPESFSDQGLNQTVSDHLKRVAEVIECGADIVDIGGQSAITGQPELAADKEAERVVPIVEWVRQRFPETIISVDTYKTAVAEQVLAAGAHLINDVSGLLYPETAEACARVGAGLVIMHTKALPKQRMQEPRAYQDIAEEVLSFLHAKIEQAIALGVAHESIILDPGPDFAKTPHQTIAMLRRLDEFRRIGRPLLLALSRKDFLGAILEKPPLGRDFGTVAAIAHFVAKPGNIVRVHDVGAAVDAVHTIDVLTGRAEIAPTYRLPDAIRHEPIRSDRSS
jgi:dihydropteroate synthase